MFTGVAFLGFYLWAVWNPGSKGPGVLITGNGKTIYKNDSGTGGGKATKGAFKP